jgi:hypothetical protein
MIPKFEGTIRKGRLISRDHHKLLAYLRSFPENCPVEYWIKKISKDRTLQQNRYYWGVVVQTLFEDGEFGYETPEEIHEALKWRFLKVAGKGPLDTVKSTTELSTVEFKGYVERIQRWATEWDIVIPDPETVLI